MNARLHSSRRDRAMTLVELVVVISMIAILSGLISSALYNARRNMALPIGVGHVMDALAAARQSAITRNRPVEVRLYLGSENNAPNDQLILCQQPENSDVYVPIEKPLKLDAEIILSPNTTWSSILPGSTPGTDSKGGYHSFRFLADGSADLSIAAEPPTFTFIYRTDAAKTALPGNFFTLQLDLQTGAIRPFRPL